MARMRARLPGHQKHKAEQRREMMPIQDQGFHGDRYLIALFEALSGSVENFVETGSEAGTTICYVATNYPNINVFSCEADPAIYEVVLHNLKGHPNVSLACERSPDFLYRLHQQVPSLSSSLSVYFLDAHGYGFRWPLKQEVRFLTNTLEKGIILVDDMKVPDHPEFGYDRYDYQECSLEFLGSSIARGKTYTVCFPDYTEHTSSYHPLRGYGVIAFGDERAENILLHQTNFRSQQIRRGLLRTLVRVDA